MPENDLNTTSRVDVVCPYCGFIHDDSWEFSRQSHTGWCRECDREFRLSADQRVTYTTAKLEADHA